LLSHDRGAGAAHKIGADRSRTSFQEGTGTKTPGSSTAERGFRQDLIIVAGRSSLTVP
jgi:hypothetical protein